MSDQIDEHDLESGELHLTGKGLVDLRMLTAQPGAAALVQLNISCNAVSSLRGIGAFSNLARLTARRNCLATLDDLRGLTGLTALDASGNYVASLQPLTGLTGLRELALHRNRVAGPSEMAVLGLLQQLARLSVFGNPAVQALGAGARAVTLVTMQGRLQILDSDVVSQDEAAAVAGGTTWSDVARRAAEADEQQQLAQQHDSGGLGRGDSWKRRSGAGSGSCSAGEASVAAAVQNLPELAVPKTKPSSLVPLSAAAAEAAAMRKEPPVIYFSNRHANGMPSVTLRRNGTGSVSWPSGGLAASADLDPAGGYRLMAMYPATTSSGAPVALSADASGGFAQHASGAAALSWRRGGAGARHGAGGEVLERWGGRRGDAPRLQHDIQQDLGGRLSATLTAGAADCALRLELGSFHPDLAHVTFSQQSGARLVFADGSDGDVLRVCGVEGRDVYGAPESAAPAAAAGAAGYGPGGGRAGSGGRQRVGGARQPAAGVGLAEGAGIVATSGSRSASQTAEVAPDVASLPQASTVAAAAAAAAAAGSDLGAVLARARALMARTYEQEQQGEQAGAGAVGST